MRSRWLSVVPVLLLFAQPSRADVVGRGFTRVPRHLIIEAGGDYSAYRFWLVSERGVEPLEISPGKPCRIDGRDREGSYRLAWVVAVPIDGNGNAQAPPVWDLAWPGPRLTLTRGLRSEEIDFAGSVPFYDSRREIIDTYRLELLPGEQVRLVWLAQNVGSWWFKASWVFAGVCLTVGWLWLSYRLLRRWPARATPAELGVQTHGGGGHGVPDTLAQHTPAKSSWWWVVFVVWILVTIGLAYTFVFLTCCLGLPF